MEGEHAEGTSGAEEPMSADWFAGRLRELREAAGLSRKELAARAGMRSEAGIVNLEQGRRLPVWDTVIALCNALGVSPGEFGQKPTTTGPPRVGRPKKPPAEADQEQVNEPSVEKPTAGKPRRKRKEG